MNVHHDLVTLVVHVKKRTIITFVLFRNHLKWVAICIYKNSKHATIYRFVPKGRNTVNSSESI